jgi:tetratricopeptide (TPR) repeat protein
LTVAAQVQMKAGKLTIAYQFARRAADLAPHNPYTWANLAMMQDQLYQFSGAEESLQNALIASKDDSAKGAIYLNWGCMLVNKGDWEAAEPIARKALSYKPDSAKAKANLGMALLGQKRWKEGWPLYDAVIGFDKSRRKVQYQNEPVWDGSPDKRIVIYGEQGLGDEISFASMVPDAIARSKSVVLDCDTKLATLFRRSFPSAKVYGTRWEKNLGWDRKDAEVDASISIGALGKLFRNKTDDFPGSAYLKADPDRVEMWRGLFSKLGKPVIGISWSGGVPWTADRFRRWSLDDLLPVFKSVDAVWVCLEYKDASREIEAFKQAHPEIDLRQYPFGTLTQDYDDTAALVASLDFVFSMQTSVIHLAGALGKDCWCFVNKCAQWRYGTASETSMPWYKSVRLWRQHQDGTWPLAEAAKQLSAKFK